MDTDEVERLIALYDACQRVKAHLAPRDVALALAIRQTCRDIEQRLNALGIHGDDPSDVPR